MRKIVAALAVLAAVALGGCERETEFEEGVEENLEDASTEPGREAEGTVLPGDE